MNKKTYNILTLTIGGLVVFGGRYIGLSLLQRIIAFIVIGGLFEIIYRKTKKENEWKKSAKIRVIFMLWEKLNL